MTDTTTTGTGASPMPDDVLLGRYRLVDRVADSSGTTLWRGYDQRLRRAVSVRFMPLDHAGAPALRDAAVRASLVTDRRAVPVLDIVEDTTSGHLVIVTEWLVGTTLGDYLRARRGEPLPAREAATLALEVARFLAAAEDVGVTHAHVRPHAVMITDSGEVRVRGLGVDQALHGVEPALDPGLADVHGAGAVLFAGLTGRWPGSAGNEDLPGVPPLAGGRTPWPSRVVADVPADLDEIAARALQTTAPPKGRGHYTNVAEVAAALSASLVTPALPSVAPRRPRRTWVRVLGVAVAVAAALGLGGLGLRMALGLGGAPLTVPRTAAARPTATTPSTAPATTTTAGERVLPIVSATDFDPYGDTKQENPQEARLAIDNNPATAWHTVHYKAADLSGKPGVGLLIDLGAPRPVSAVVLRLVGNGTDLSLLATDNPTKPVGTFVSMAEVTGAGNALTLRVPRPVTTRYLLIWLTQLPPSDGSYQGGVADVRVLG